MRYENKNMKSDKPTREKYVFCNEKSRKNKLLHSQRVSSQKVFLIFANEISLRNIFLINNPSINQQDHEKAIRTFCGMRSCRM